MQLEPFTNYRCSHSPFSHFPLIIELLIFSWIHDFLVWYLHFPFVNHRSRPLALKWNFKLHELNHEFKLHEVMFIAMLFIRPFILLQEASVPSHMALYRKLLKGPHDIAPTSNPSAWSKREYREVCKLFNYIILKVTHHHFYQRLFDEIKSPNSTHA